MAQTTAEERPSLTAHWRKRLSNWLRKPRTRPSDWLLDYGIVVIGGVLTCALLLILVVWLGVNFVWAAGEDTAEMTAAKQEFAGTPLIISARYPHVALAGVSGHNLQLDFAPQLHQSLPGITLTAVIALADGLTFGPSGGPAVRVFAVPLAPANPDDWRISVINSETRRGFFRRPGSIAVQLCDFSAGSNCLAEPLLLQPQVEGLWGFRVRRFVNSTVDRASPLILLLAVAVPWAAALMQREVDAQRKTLTEQRRDAFQTGLEDLREQLRMSNIEEADRSLSKLCKKEYSLWNKESIVTGSALLCIARLEFEGGPGEKGKTDWPERDLRQKAQRWPEEFAAVYCIARQTLKTRKVSLQAYYSKDNDATWAVRKDKLTNFIREMHQEVQYQAFPNNPALEVSLASWAAEQSDLNPVSEIQRRLPVVEPALTDYKVAQPVRLAFPFARHDARDIEEQRFLSTYFRQGQSSDDDRRPTEPLLANGYYGGALPPFAWSAPAGCIIVHGPTGCGRTAMRIHLHCMGFAQQPERLLVRMDSQPSTTRMAQATVRQFLHFILAHPTHLMYLGPAQRSVLARLLVRYLEDSAVSMLERGQMSLATAHDLKKQDFEDRQDSKVEIDHEQMARRLLEEFKRTIMAEGGRSALPRLRDQNLLDSSAWFTPVLEGANVLGFSDIVFSYDCQGPEQWVKEHILDHLDVWSAMRISFCLFMPDELNDSLQTDLLHVNLYPIQWDKRRFQAMIQWRYNNFLMAAGLPIARRERQLRSLFKPPSELDRLVQASLVGDQYNPRQFMRLWCAAVGNKLLGERIEKADVDNALSSAREGHS